MKLTAGLGNIEDYGAYAEAGVDEVFCGYVPAKWQDSYGPSMPLNRREVCFSNVQIGSENELRMLAKEVERRGVPVALTFNAPSYGPEAYENIAEVIGKCRKWGFSSFILADPGLMLYLRETEKEAGEKEPMAIHLSGEWGVLNRYSLGLVEELGITRIIFQRQTGPREMKSLREASGRIREFEAFLLNEKCRYMAGYCSSIHCDMLPPMCREYYEIVGEQKTDPKTEGGTRSRGNAVYGDCGLCALWQLREAGVTHLKIVGRGAGTQQMLQDIGRARRALRILEESSSEKEYIRRMTEELFPDGCSGECYY